MLEELGATPDAVAATLRSLGIKGIRNTARFLNPIVRYLTPRVPDTSSVDLTLGDRLRIVFADGRVDEVAVPDAVLQFLDNFHRGQYPELEMPTGPGSP
jgi:hypothetical protein